VPPETPSREEGEVAPITIRFLIEGRPRIKDRHAAVEKRLMKPERKM